MIFVTLGSQKFQFDRLLKEVDNLVSNNMIKQEIFAQIGNSEYEPLFYQYKSFLDREEFSKKVNECDIVITHGGTGAIVSALKAGKKVIAVPRLERYKEHVDDHQLQIVKQFESMKMILSCAKINDLEKKINEIENLNFNPYQSNRQEIVDSIDTYLRSI